MSSRFFSQVNRLPVLAVLLTASLFSGCTQSQVNPALPTDSDFKIQALAETTDSNLKALDDSSQYLKENNTKPLPTLSPILPESSPSPEPSFEPAPSPTAAPNPVTTYTANGIRGLALDRHDGTGQAYFLNHQTGQLDALEGLILPGYFILNDPRTPHLNWTAYYLSSVST